MKDWINLNKQLPPQGKKIKIKAQYNDDQFVEAEAIFKIYDIDERTEAYGWLLGKDEQEKYGTLRPTHWMPLSELNKGYVYENNSIL